jgi:hypothetical protein
VITLVTKSEPFLLKFCGCSSCRLTPVAAELVVVEVVFKDCFHGCSKIFVGSTAVEFEGLAKPAFHSLGVDSCHSAPAFLWFICLRKQFRSVSTHAVALVR